jgi:hypothetical protein
MMKRTLKTVAAAAVLLLFASSAYAASSLSLIWRQTGTATIDTTTNVPDGPPGKSGGTILDVVLAADTVGLVGIFISFLYDTDLGNEMDFSSGIEDSLVNLKGAGNSFSPLALGFGPLPSTESTGAVGGKVQGFDQASLSTGALSQTKTLGSLVFTFNKGITDGIDITIAVLINGVDTIVGPGGSNLSASTIFNGASVDGQMPEPTTAILIVLGLAGLGFAGRRSIG